MKNIIKIIIVVAMFLCVCVADDFQQKEYKRLDEGYTLMYENNYKEAYEVFEKYLDSHSTIYWFMTEKVNGRSSKLTQANAEKALRYCSEKMN